MRALTVLVVVMGLMILGGFVAIFVTIATRASHPRPAPAAQSRPAAAAPLSLPAGARIESMSLGGNRLALAVVLADGSRRILIIDLATGRQVGAIPLATAP